MLQDRERQTDRERERERQRERKREREREQAFHKGGAGDGRNGSEEDDSDRVCQETHEEQ
jgi:hypothetical protein